MANIVRANSESTRRVFRQRERFFEFMAQMTGQDDDEDEDEGHRSPQCVYQ
jgi:hypothetical protein